MKKEKHQTSMLTSVLGCPDIETVEDGKAIRNGNTVTVTCSAGSTQLTCVGNQWQGTKRKCIAGACRDVIVNNG